MMKIICASVIKVKKADIKLRGASKKTKNGPYSCVQLHHSIF